MAANAKVKIHSQVVVPLGIDARLKELIRYLEIEAPPAWARMAAESMLTIAQGGLTPGAGKLTGTLHDSLEWNIADIDTVPRRLLTVTGRTHEGDKILGFKDGVRVTRIYTTATRGEQRAAEYAMRYEAARNGPVRRGVHLRGAKARGLPFAGNKDDEGYAVYVEEGRPRSDKDGNAVNRRPVPFMSNALAAGLTTAKGEIAAEARVKIHAAMSI